MLTSKTTMWLVTEHERTGDCGGVSLVANHGVFDSEERAIAWAEANIIVEKGWRWYFVEKVDFNPGDALC